MCGICGIYYFDKERRVDEGLLKVMNNLMVHRGPDDEGYHINGNIGLGHRRLSIIDLAGGHQPMGNEDGTVWITYNGEVYNYKELRRALETKGHLFRTGSDTEVIIHAYEEYGEAVCEKLRGIFAFAIWDEKKRELLLARDRIGVKPIYYFRNGDCLLFASEMKALLVHEEVNKVVNLEAINYYLSLRYVPGPETMIKDVFKLAPGHVMVAENGGQSKLKRYWDLQTNELVGRDGRKHLDELYGILKTSVKLRLMSDVPLGAFLSGGIDSSAIVALMSELGVNPLNTFTIGATKKGEINEFPYARIVSEKFQTRHFEEEITYGDIAELIKKVTWHFDEPVSDPPSFALYLISKFARQNVKVVLSGEGGDEVFAGYYIYFKMLMLDRLQRSGMLKAPLRLLRKCMQTSRLLSNMELAELPLEERYFGVAAFHTEDEKKEMLSENLRQEFSTSLAERFRAYYSATKGLPSLKRMLYIDLKSWLPDEILLKADKMSMANSIELRVPFLDHEVVEYCYSLPSKLKIKLGKTKLAQKRIMTKRLPKEILGRRKVGFQIALDGWLRNDLDGFAQEMLLSRSCRERGYYDEAVISKLFSQHKSGRANNADKLWRLITLEVWHRTFIDGEGI